MSDGHTNETRELNLDEQHLGMIEDAAARARGIPGADTLASIFVPALVAEVRHLRAKVGRAEALADKWNETPDYAPSDYDRGRVDQRHDMTEELLTALDAEVSS